MKRRPFPSAFTLIELLVVIAIISLLVSILLPSLQRAKIMAGRAVCLSNLHQIYIGHHFYANDNNGWVVVHDRTNGLLYKVAGIRDPEPPHKTLWFDLGHRYLAPYLGEDGDVYRCPGSTPAPETERSACWYNGPQISGRSAMKFDEYRVTNGHCRDYASKPLCFDYILGGRNTGDKQRAAVWHDNRTIPVLMSDGSAYNWRAPDDVNIPWGFDDDLSYSGTEYSYMGRDSLVSMCEQQ